MEDRLNNEVQNSICLKLKTSVLQTCPPYKELKKMSEGKGGPNSRCRFSGGFRLIESIVLRVNENQD